MAREIRAETRTEEGRRQRIPLGTPQLKLSAPKRPGFVRRWVNDDGARLQLAQDAGYAFAESEHPSGSNAEPGTRVSRVVGSKEDGSPLKAYLMEQREEWYAEDQATKQAEIDKTEQQIKAGNIDGKSADGRYIPPQGIKVEQR